MIAQTEIFQTDAIRASSRVGYWNQVANSILGAIAVQPVTPQFRGQIKRRQFGDMQLVHVHSTPVAVTGLRNPAGRGVFLLANRRGACRVGQASRQTWLEPGELTLLRTDQPYRIEAGQAHETLILHIPLAIDEVCWDSHFAVAHGAGESALLVSFMQRLAALGQEEKGPGSLLRTTLDLLELTWPQPKAARASAATWQRRMQEWVARQLDDPGLNAATIAAELGISERYVHALFARMGTTASAFILESRLQRAAERLLGDREARIGDVAFDLGFNDLSHFCRSFRKRFGLSAREFRTRPLG